MSSSMPRAANSKNGANKASVALETEPSLKKFKSSDIFSSPPTIETPEGSKQGSPSNGKNRDEELLYQYCRMYQEMRGPEIVLQNRTVFLKRVEPLLSPEFRSPLYAYCIHA